MSAITEFKCPNCGGKLEFDATTQQMKCPYCDSEINIEAVKQNEEILNEVSKQDNMNWESTPDSKWTEEDLNSLASYICKSCGGEIIADQTTGATHCPYCGNPVVMNSKFTGALKPELIIPFKLTKQQAKDKLKEIYKGKKLLPKVFSSENHLDEIKGLYVPVWLFDANAEASVSYNMTNIRSWEDRSYRYTETSFYSGFRRGDVSFANIPVDGAEKMPDDMMESLEPFNMQDAVPFNTAYLSGFLADRYDVDENKCLERANERVKRSTEEVFRSTVNNYTTVNVNDSYVDLHDSKAKYALYPVWLLTTSFMGKQYLFAVNGQTGKIVGNMPADKSLANKYRLLYTLGIGAASYVIIYLIMSLGGML